TDVLPEALTFVSATDGGVYDPDAHTVTWDLGSVPAGEDVLVSVTVRAPLEGALIVNTASVTTACDPADPDPTIDDPLEPACPLDPNPDEPTEEIVEVIPVADLSILKEGPGEV